MNPDQFEAKKWWQRPENWVSAIPLIGLGFLGILYANPILEWLIELAQNVLLAGGLFAAIAVLGFLATSADLHKLLGLAYTGFMKRLTNFVYAVYPLEIMEGYLEDLHKKQKKVTEAIGNLRGQLSKLAKKLDKKQSDHMDALKFAQAAHQRASAPGMQAQLAFQARRAGRAEKQTVTYQNLINQLKRLIALMEKVHEATKFMILDITDTIESEKEQRETVTEAVKAMKAAQAILFSSKKRDEFDRALEANQQFVGQQMGLLEQFEQDTQDILSGIDIENDIVKLEALDKIQAMEAKLGTLLSGGTGSTKYRIDPTLPRYTEGDIQQQEELEHQEAQANTSAKRQSFADLYKR
jgi:hypothetical protein